MEEFQAGCHAGVRAMLATAPLPGRALVSGQDFTVELVATCRRERQRQPVQVVWRRLVAVVAVVLVGLIVWA